MLVAEGQKKCLNERLITAYVSMIGQALAPPFAMLDVMEMAGPRGSNSRDCPRAPCWPDRGRFGAGCSIHG
jgi:hypothetical protein